MTERWTDERLDCFATTVETAFAASDERMTRFEMGLQALSRDVAILVERQQATDTGIDRLTNITERYINSSSNVIDRMDQTVARLDQNIEELRASNRRQERINDFLLRWETEGNQ